MWSRQVQGAERPLLCLHGWGHTHQSLEPLAKFLTRAADPFLFDLPGFGKSPIPPDVWSADDYACHLADWMEKENIPRASILGHSFGGKVAMCLAEMFPQKVERLILLAPSGLKPKASLPIRLRKWSVRASARCVKTVDRLCGTSYFVDRFIPRFGSRDYQNAGNMRPILVKSVNEDLSPRLKGIQCPTLILWGEKDGETPVEMGRRLNQAIPGSCLRTFPHHNHNLCQDVGAHLMASHILPFFKEGA